MFRDVRSLLIRQAVVQALMRSAGEMTSAEPVKNIWLGNDYMGDNYLSPRWPHVTLEHLSLVLQVGKGVLDIYRMLEHTPASPILSRPTSAAGSSSNVSPYCFLIHSTNCQASCKSKYS